MDTLFIIRTCCKFILVVAEAVPEKILTYTEDILKGPIKSKNLFLNMLRGDAKEEANAGVIGQLISVSTRILL